MIVKIVSAISSFDRSAIAALPGLRYNRLDAFVVAVTFTGSGYLWFPFAAFMIVTHIAGRSVLPDHGLFLSCMTGSLFSLIAGQVLKRIVKRQRPVQTVPGHRVIGRDHRDYSMPSTHTSTSTALAVGLIAFGHPWGIFAPPWAFLVMASRYYLGVHYPTDLICGASLGVLFGLFDWTTLVGAFFG